MKTKTRVITALAFFIVAIGNAADFPKMNVIQVEAEKALVAYNADQATPLVITLTNCHGDILYFKKTKQRFSEYKKIFDFSELGEGNYCICINYGNQSVSRNLTVSNDQIAAGPSQQLYEPYFKLEGDMLGISFLNCPQKQVYINVYQNGKLVNGMKLGKNLSIQKRLDLSRLQEGEYEIVLSDCYKDHRFMAKL